jgi:hypothetical protein
MANPPPNARQLHAALGHLPPKTMHAKMPTDHDLVTISSPFTEFSTPTAKVHYDDPSLGIVMGVCVERSRVFLMDIKGGSSASKI